MRDQESSEDEADDDYYSSDVDDSAGEMERVRVVILLARLQYISPVVVLSKNQTIANAHIKWKITLSYLSSVCLFS